MIASSILKKILRAGETQSQSTQLRAEDVLNKQPVFFSCLYGQYDSIAQLYIAKSREKRSKYLDSLFKCTSTFFRNKCMHRFYTALS